MSYLGLDAKILTLLDTRLGGHESAQLAGLGRIERSRLFELLEDEIGMAMDPWARDDLTLKSDLNTDDIIAAFEEGILLW